MATTTLFLPPPPPPPAYPVWSWEPYCCAWSIHADEPCYIFLTIRVQNKVVATVVAQGTRNRNESVLRTTNVIDLEKKGNFLRLLLPNSNRYHKICKETYLRSYITQLLP